MKQPAPVRLLALALVLALLPLAASAPARAQRAGSTTGMVVTSEPHATRAGIAMLELGGNAVDAAVAAAFALAVTQPFSAGLGGGAFLTLRTETGELVAIDARETAPAAATRDMYVREGVREDASVTGGLAVATPGFVAGLLLAMERYGTLGPAVVLGPALRLAQRGFPIGPYHAAMLHRVERYGLRQHFPETAAIQLPPEGEPIAPGWWLVQPDLSRTLRKIMLKGREAFYERALAHHLVAGVRRYGGLLRREDLRAYEPKIRPVVRGSYRGHEIVSFPPPSSGGAVLIEALNILEGFDLARLGPGSSASRHRVAEALKLAFADRATWFGDPDFVDVPVARLTSKDYAAGLRARINPPWWRRAPWQWGGTGEVAIRVEGSGLPLDDAGTTHLSTADADGNAVALTMTINTPFGSGITPPGTGVVMNNEMDDFAKAPHEPNVYGLVDLRGANAIAPGKRPLSSMTPTLVLRDGELFMVTGSPGGPRIISTTLQTIVNVIDHGMDVRQAVAAPRIHHQWLPDVLYVEPWVPADVVAALRARGHAVEVGERPWSAAEAIVRDPETGGFEGGADPRRDGVALAAAARAEPPPRIDPVRTPEQRRALKRRMRDLEREERNLPPQP